MENEAVIRPGRPGERKRGRFWREVCTCGWIGRQWSNHRAAVERFRPMSKKYEEHRRERYGWYGDEAATKKPERNDDE